MRTIKFRGKRIDNGEWVYGAFYPIKDERVYFIINNCQSIDFDDNSTFFNGYKVHKKSVGQFTGLHDKNGKEIYNGDIIGDWNEIDGKMEQSKLTVYFDEMLGQWMIDISFNKDFTTSCPLFSELKDFEYEVIGSIYENPELLEKKFAD